MTLPRKQLISIENTPYYHIITRCVRRAFLCGKDKYSGNCYEHRRKLIIDRIKKLAEVFNIDICAYAIMSNHYHLVLKVNDTKEWSERKCLIDWASLCGISDICQRYIKHESLTKAELDLVYRQADVYRICNLFVHSYVFMIVGEDKMDGVFISTDRTKNKKLYFISIDQIVSD